MRGPADDEARDTHADFAPGARGPAGERAPPGPVPPTPEWLGRYRLVVRVGSAVVLLAGASALTGWLIGEPALAALQADLKPMMPWTALGHLSLGVLLLLAGGARRNVASRAGHAILAIAVGALGLIALLETLLNWDAGIDGIFFTRAVEAVGVAAAGRPAVGSGVGFLTGGAAMLLFGSASERHIRAAQALALPALMVGVLALLGYAYGAPRFYDWPRQHPISLPSAIAFAAFGAAALLLRPDRGYMAVLTAGDLGGSVARRLLGLALITPLAMGWLRLLGRQGEMGTVINGLVILTLSAMVLLAGAGWVSGRNLQLLEGRWRAAQDALQRSEARLQATLEALPIGVWFTDETGRLIYGNPAGRQIWGGAKYVQPGSYDVYRGWWPDTGRRLRSEEWAVSRAIRYGETSIDEEILIEAFDGTRKLLRNSAVPLIGPSGEMQGAVILNEDITERRRIEKEREREREYAEQRLREEAALRRATGAVAAAFTLEEVIRTIAGSAVEATPADAALVERVDPGRDETEIVAWAGSGQPLAGIGIPYAGSLAQRVIDAGRPLRVEDVGEAEGMPAHLRDGYPGHEALAVPMIEADLPIGALIVLRRRNGRPFDDDAVHRATTFAQLASVTFRKAQILEDSERRRVELQRVLEGQAWLIRGFSHDLKNPLGAADGQLALMEAGVPGQLEAAQLEALGRARRSIGSALRLIDSLVEFARAESGQVEIRQSDVDVPAIVQEVADEHRPAAMARGLSLDVQRIDVRTLRSDPDRVRQILGNLLSNAVKYTTHGGIRVNVSPAREGLPEELGARRDTGPWVAIAVTDTGPGIPADRLEDVFAEFIRLDPSAGSGAGLGLAVSRRLARLLGGELTVASQAGKGSTFTLWLPRHGKDERRTAARR